ncbi:hypothetical protein SH501x_000909 [Pirellulaceae bacterium SH501]
MIVVYGNYRHRQDSTGITVSTSIEENETGVPYRAVTEVNVEGRLRNKRLESPRYLDPIIREMELAYSQPGMDFGMLHDDGTRSSVWFRNADTIGGIRPRLLAYPNYRGGEYVNYRQFQIQLTVMQPVVGAPEYIRFSESLSIDGGGGEWDVKEVNFGRGVRHRTRTHKKCTAVQSGSAVGRGEFPRIPPPIWPFALRTEEPKIEREIRPRGGYRTGNIRLEECEISWTYEYVWPVRLDGIPHYAIG